MIVYIAGPMRHYELYNFPAFDAAEAELAGMGHQVINPATLDRQAGLVFPPDQDWDKLPEGVGMFEVFERDIAALRDCDAVYMLDGWQRSVGAQAEHWIARWLGLHVMHQTHEDAPQESICKEADRLVATDRNADYGHPHDDFSRTAKIWGAIFGIDVTPQQVGLAMVGVKMSREVNRPKRDNLVDMAGYAKCVSLCNERETIGGE